MMKNSLANNQHTPHNHALFQLGFRPFFLFTSIFSVIGMGIWMAELIFSIRLIPNIVSPVYWHAHEMIYGYTLAAIAGFLLTSVKNWANEQTLQGWSLFVLVLIWIMARITMLIPSQQAVIAELVLDTLFIAYLSIALTLPLIKTKQWKSMATVSKVYSFLAGHVIYSLGVLGLYSEGQRVGIYIGLYMAISLILVLSRRIMPMFIERGVGYPVTLKNRTWVDISCFVLFLFFSITDVFFQTPALTAYLAGLLCLSHSIRLWGWHTPGIWKKPLLWSLYMAYMWIIIAFTLKFFVFVAGIPTSLVVHAFTVGGIGMMTLAMMSRISWGHTGRNIMQPPKGIGLMFLILCLGAISRVLLPIISPDNAQFWLGLSQTFWIIAFASFIYLYAMVLIRPRIDGRRG